MLGRAWLGLVAALALTACGPGSTMGNDAGACQNPPVTNPRLFGRCSADSECPGGGRCLTQAASGYPGGFCTQPCTRSYECESGQPGVTGYCGMLNGEMLCQRECLNGFDCGREGYTCVEIDPEQELSLCTPSCTDAACGPCGQCNHHTGRCEAQGTPASTAHTVGGTCTRSGMGSECASGQCIAAQSASTMAATGYNGGYCWSLCALPEGWNSSDLYPDPLIPQSNCPANSICFPNGGELSERSEGICLAECRSSADCREADGYYCRKSFRLSMGRRNFDNGYCAPIDCAQAGMYCPEGMMCQVRTTRQSDGSTLRTGYCVR